MAMALALLTNTRVIGADVSAPFTIPPSGEPERLAQNLDCPTPTAMAFDSKNRPYLINTRQQNSVGQLWTLRKGQWVVRSFRDVLHKKTMPGKRQLHAQGELVIDDQDALYARVGDTLVYSADLGKTFQAYPCHGSLELRTGPTAFSMPPAICVVNKSRYVDRDAAKWAKRGTLAVLLPVKTSHGLDLGEPIKVSDSCLAAGSGGHSGGTSFAVTIGNFTHLVYAECPDDITSGGNPIYVATIDRDKRKVVSNQFLVNAPPGKADVHTRPTITADTDGFLHVLSGSHGQPFWYMRSLQAGDISKGWAKPTKLSGRQCYASIICDNNNQLHTVFREWRPHATLGYASADASSGTWTFPKTVVLGALTPGKYQYGIFYHRLFVDRRSNLYLSFTFFEFQSGENGNYPEVLAVSSDGGKSWRLASTNDLVAARSAGN